MRFHVIAQHRDGHCEAYRIEAASFAAAEHSMLAAFRNMPDGSDWCIRTITQFGKFE